MTIKHKELVGSIAGGNFSQLSFKIQPGLQNSFPWLYSIACNFEYYHINSMNFEIVSNVPSTSKGIFYSAIDYNAADQPVIENVSQIAMYSGVQIDKVFEKSILQFQPSKTTRQRMRVRCNPGLPANVAIQDYDAGTAIFVVSGNSDSGDIAQVFVNYDITLSVPQPSLINEAENQFYSEMSTLTPTENITNIADVLVDKNKNYIDLSIGDNISLQDKVFSFLRSGTYVVNLVAQVANTITAAGQTAMMDAIKTFQVFGLDGAVMSNLDGNVITAADPVWTQIGTSYVTSIAFLVTALNTANKFGFGKGISTTLWDSAKVQRLSLSILPKLL